MPRLLSNTELPLGSNQTPPVDRPARRSRRLTVFLLTFIVSLAIGLIYDFQRSAIYRSSASLLTVAPPEVDQLTAEADIQHVAIQRQRLLSLPLLEKVVQKLTSEGSDDEIPIPSVYQLQVMLDVISVPETNLVELRAEGPDAALLPRLVNTWVKVYLGVRTDEIRRVTETTTNSLREQYEALGQKITDKREALDNFRKSNDILSIGRDENQVLARLKGLNDSLNTAIEEEIKAKARLDTIKAAIKRGQTVVPDQDKRSLAQMEARAQALREQLAGLDRRYTREFLALTPELKVIPEQLAKLENAINRRHRLGRNIVVTMAEQEYAAARQTTAELRQELQGHKQKATEFTAKFAEHEALVEDLARIEELYRVTEDRLVQIKVKNRGKYPQLMVVDWGILPAEPIWPLYLRDAGIVFAGSLLVALFMVWLVDFLAPKREAEHPASPIDITIYPGEGKAAITQPSPDAVLESRSSPTLAGPSTRELTEPEVISLYKAADSATQQLIFLLLNGVSPQELLLINRENIDLEKNRIAIPGNSPRDLPLPAAIAELFTENGGPCPGWKESKETVPDREELDARLKLAALAGKLSDSDQVDAESLRHTYLLYLVRQGVRLSELEQIVGTMPSKTLLGYRRFSPDEADKPLDQISTVYPLFS